MKKYLLLLTFGLLFFADSAFAQKEINWNFLADYDFELRYNDETELYFRFPLFSEKVKKIAGEEVEISGYMIPVDVEANYYVISAFPFANCFFCGGAGPESVIELEMKPGHRRYKTDEKVTMKGKFKLNSVDIYQLSYILEEAEEVK